MSRINIVVPIVLIIATVYTVVYHVREPAVLKDVKERYSTLRKYIKDNQDSVDKKFNVLTKEILVTGFFKKLLSSKNAIGYNVNKGYEIGVCIDGEPNDIFHVLIHELAHSVSSKYSHDDEFWKNFSDLKDLCVKCGVYTKIKEKKFMCGGYIHD